MRARILVVAGLAIAAPAAADIQPKKVDVSAFRDQLIVLRDADGGTYVVKPYDAKTRDAARLWYGASGKPLYEQILVGRSANGRAWDLNTWAPRLPFFRPGALRFRADGSYFKDCDGKDDAALTQLTGDKARAVIDRGPFLTEYLVRRPHMLARDDAGVYYYVDHYARAYGGKGFRVFVGKKGAMRALPLVDVASDSAGEVFATRAGDLRLTHGVASDGTSTAMWIRGGKRTQLIWLPVDNNMTVIYSDLGIYGFLGTLCDNI